MPYLFTIHPRRLLQLSVYGNYTDSERKLMLLHDNLVEEGYLFRHFSPSLSEGNSKEVKAEPDLPS